MAGNRKQQTHPAGTILVEKGGGQSWKVSWKAFVLLLGKIQSFVG